MPYLPLVSFSPSSLSSSSPSSGSSPGTWEADLPPLEEGNERNESDRDGRHLPPTRKGAATGRSRRVDGFGRAVEGEGVVWEVSRLREEFASCRLKPLIVEIVEGLEDGGRLLDLVGRSMGSLASAFTRFRFWS